MIERILRLPVTLRKRFSQWWELNRLRGSMGFVLMSKKIRPMQLLKRGLRLRVRLSKVLALTFNMFCFSGTQLVEEAQGAHRNSGSSSSRIAIHALAKNTETATGLAIVFIHKSWSDYLAYSLAQAKSFNPHSPVYLLGDAANDRFDFVDHRPMANYFQAAADFAKVYRHYSTSSYQFELFNFQRWLILKEFLSANGIERCLYLDSDTMLYADVTVDSARFAQCDFTVSHQSAGNTFYLNRAESLHQFCAFLFDLYTKKDKYHHDKMIADYAVRRLHGLNGGVCDMSAIKMYREIHFGETREIAEIIDDSVYDPAIAAPEPGFEMENGIKKLVLKDGVPYGTHISTGKLIKFNSLHFQGWHTKKLMERFYTGRTLIQI